MKLKEYLRYFIKGVVTIILNCLLDYFCSDSQISTTILLEILISMERSFINSKIQILENILINLMQRNSFYKTYQDKKNGFTNIGRTKKQNLCNVELIFTQSNKNAT